MFVLTTLQAAMQAVCSNRITSCTSYGFDLHMNGGSCAVTPVASPREESLPSRLVCMPRTADRGAKASAAEGCSLTRTRSRVASRCDTMACFAADALMYASNMACSHTPTPHQLISAKMLTGWLEGCYTCRYDARRCVDSKFGSQQSSLMHLQIAELHALRRQPLCCV